MPATYELISTYTMPSNATSVTLSSIPSTYTDLVVVIANCKVVDVAAGIGLACRFNSDTGNNYEYMGLYANGSINGGTYAQPFTMDYIGVVSDSAFSTLVMYVNDYATTGKYRTLLSHCGNSIFNSTYTSNWNNTANAINSITFICDGGSAIVANSQFTLYGITKA